MNNYVRVLWVLPFCIAIGSGCSKNPNAPSKISGKVTLEGRPITAGTISFVSKEHGSVTVGIKDDGTYEATELPVGEFAVTIETESANPERQQQSYKGGAGGEMEGKYGGKMGSGGAPKAKENETAAEMSPKPKDAPTPKGTYTKIPDRYGDTAQSGFKVNLSKGGNKQDFNLTN